MGDSSFLDLLKPENLGKLKIDEKLIPIFKVVIRNINDYFIKNGLMNVKDWKGIFNKYLLSNSSEQFSICLEDIDNSKATVCKSGYFDERSKRIVADIKYIDDEFIYNILCHEFIHFLSKMGRKSLNKTPADVKVFNEALTEITTQEIMNNKTNIYSVAISLTNMYRLLRGTSDLNPFVELISELNFDNYYLATNLDVASSSYMEPIDIETKNAGLIRTQLLIINNFLDYKKIDSFDKFLEILHIINMRPDKRRSADYEYITTIYKKMVDAYLKNTGMTDVPAFYKKRLFDLCVISDKASIYGNLEVAECVFDDLYITFEKGEKYCEKCGEFPQDGKTQRGGIETNPYTKKITIQHKDKEYVIGYDELKYTNWQETYKNYLIYIKQYISEQERKKKHR